MNWLGYLAIKVEVAKTYIYDLSTIVRSPRQFFELVRYEPGSKVFERLAVYTTAFSFLSIALYATAIPIEFQLYTFWGIVFSEALFALLYFPILYAVLVVSGQSKGKSVFNGALTTAFALKFLASLPLIIFYALFLITESYAFAFVRGCLHYVFLVLFVVVVPFAFFKNLKTLFISIATILLFFIGFSALVYFGRSRFVSEEDRFSYFSYISDPIYLEIDRSNLLFANDLPGEVVSFANQLIDGKRIIKLPSRGQNHLDSSRIVFLPQGWALYRGDARLELEKERQRLEELLPKTNFRTTNKFIVVRQDAIQKSIVFTEAADKFFQSPGLPERLFLLQKYRELLEANNLQMTGTIKYLATWNFLARYGLIVY